MNEIMSTLTIVAGIIWHGVGLTILDIAIYATIYIARLFDITKRQFSFTLAGGLALSIISDVFHYFTSTHMPHYLYDDIFTYTELTVLSVVFVFLICFLAVGRGNLERNYNLDMRGLNFRKIKKLKNARH